ncbi:MAG: DUF1501 domain-containing protein [Pirellulales bacterium]|nr:DUF1501 domain-containing protein [Pirellulales bacterium]
MPNPHTAAFSRHEFLQAGFSGLLGLGLADVLSARDTSPQRPAAKAATPASGGAAKSVILVFQTGAPAHQDIWDLKPDAPDTVRGEFQPIDTDVPGIHVGPHIPRLARMAHKYAIVRSMTHSTPGHEYGTHFVLSGINKLPPGATHMASRADWPCYSAGVQHLRPRPDGLPSGVMLPTYLNNGYGFSGQSGGLMGPDLDPWHVTKDPNDPDFKLDELSFLPGLSVSRLGQRRSLVESFDAARRKLTAAGNVLRLSDSQQKAYDLLCSDAEFRRAFEIEREPVTMRDLYGRHAYGQSLLLARRLVEAGIPVIQVNMGKMNTWDTHNNNFKRLKNDLLPPFDQGLSALLQDLEDRGLLETTLVVAVGEFGRTPTINKDAGRDHWSGVFSAVFAGAGVRGGQVIGASDPKAAYPATRGWYPADLGATIYTALGIHPQSTITDPAGRPHRLNKGQVIAPLFS